MSYLMVLCGGIDVMSYLMVLCGGTEVTCLT